MTWLGGGDTLHGAVYLAEAGRYIKIGMTACDLPDAERAVATRVRKLAKSCPLPLEPRFHVWVEDALGVEAELHRKLGKYRVTGEWFKPPRGKTIEILLEMARRDQSGRRV